MRPAKERRYGRIRRLRRPVVGLWVLAALATACAQQSERIVFDSPTTSEAPSVSVPPTTADELPTTTSTTLVPAPTTDPAPSVTTQQAERAAIVWNGTDAYVHGANLPWINFGCDFGCGQDGGVSSPFPRAVATEALNRARDAGMSTVRWWLFPEVRQHVEIDNEGLPVGFKAAVYEDLDTALVLAEAADIDLVLTLFAGPLEIPSEWLKTPEARLRFVDVLDDLFVRYANHPRIMTWQVMNEPEWAIWNNVVDAGLVRDFVREIAERVHASTSALVSLGSARMDGLPYWTDLGLDYLTVHWYENMTERTQCVPCVSYLELAGSLETELPILIGEFNFNQLDPLERLQRFHDLGYAGAFAWSLLPDRTADGLGIVDDVSREFAAELDTS